MRTRTRVSLLASIALLVINTSSNASWNPAYDGRGIYRGCTNWLPFGGASYTDLRMDRFSCWIVTLFSKATRAAPQNESEKELRKLSSELSSEVQISAKDLQKTDAELRRIANGLRQAASEVDFIRKQAKTMTPDQVKKRLRDLQSPPAAAHP